MATFNVNKRVFARERLTFTSATPVTLSATLYNNLPGYPIGVGNQVGTVKRKASAALLSLMSGTGTLQFTVDGTTPTIDSTAVGAGAPAVAPGQILLETYEAIVNFKGIAAAGNSIVEVWYFR